MNTVSRKDLLQAADDLGISYGKRETSTSIAKKIKDVSGEDYQVEAAAPAAIADKVKAATEAREAAPEVKALKENDMIRCIIHPQDAEDKMKVVKGHLNGERFEAPLRTEIDFPRKFLPCIKDAVHEVKEAILNEEGNPTGKYIDRVVKRYIMETV